jgi:hypothetical protein
MTLIYSWGNTPSILCNRILQREETLLLLLRNEPYFPQRLSSQPDPIKTDNSEKDLATEKSHKHDREHFRVAE